MKKHKLFLFICFMIVFLFPSFLLSRKYPVKNVDHSNPHEFAKATEQTKLKPETVEKLKKQFPQPNNLAKIRAIYRWIKKNFTGERGGGRMVAKRSAAEIFQSKKLTGCNDKGLLVTAILRVFDFPVVFMNAAGIDWAKKYRKNPRGKRSGHVFLEVFLLDEKKWIVLDSTSSEYIDDYDYNDPVIPIPKSGANERGYFVYQKGKDHWTMGIRSIKDNAKLMKAFAKTYSLETIVIRTKEIKRLLKKGKRKKRIR